MFVDYVMLKSLWTIFVVFWLSFVINVSLFMERVENSIDSVVQFYSSFHVAI